MLEEKGVEASKAHDFHVIASLFSGLPLSGEEKRENKESREKEEKTGGTGGMEKKGARVFRAFRPRNARKTVALIPAQCIKTRSNRRHFFFPAVLFCSGCAPI